ncbi:unnamed protein product [Symbiodinium natans]|uniref:Uncharacterized protein n=1 Tax=Symbiodinium natans TaxID=878477 RepID=A0A812K8T4_9DINO|nr:unnamed protein product [Symbiodinium natans]
MTRWIWEEFAWQSTCDAFGAQISGRGECEEGDPGQELPAVAKQQFNQVFKEVCRIEQSLAGQRLAADLASASAAHRDALRAAAERRRRAVRSLLAERRARYQANAPAHSEPPLPILLGHESRESALQLIDKIEAKIRP